ncbi:hypothetical protein DV736_g6341, partial [Chaetothyriales sp. CBS 134916]
MALEFPYTYISCPCSDISRRVLTSKPASRDVELVEELDQEEKAFDPRHPRSAFSLFPPEHLLYCEECHDLKCPRCVKEEILSWYCPYCLFETPSSTVRNETNRCARNCFNCPICTSQLVTAPVGDNKDGPFILNCNYCMWSTLDIGITFAQPTSIRAQLDRQANGGKPKPPSRVDSVTTTTAAVDASRTSSLVREPMSPTDSLSTQNLSDALEDSASPLMDPTLRFTALCSFYKDQIASASSNESGLPTAALDLYSSPSSLARIMNLYSSVGTGGGMKKGRTKPSVMREALTRSEGLQALSDSMSSSEQQQQPQPLDYIDTPSLSQLRTQHPSSLGNPVARSVSDLRPIPALLRTKRSKRCATCSHILVRPEFKPTSTRYRIKLLALNYIPFVTLRPASQWILTMRNPLYENVNVTLGAEAMTPGRHRHRVTILCPEFEVGKSGDVWDDALDFGKAVGGGRGSDATAKRGAAGEGIAGKVYDKGRNWVSVVLEIVPSLIERKGKVEAGEQEDEDENEDEDVVEVPIRVRLEWRQSEGEDDVAGKGVEKWKQEVN